MSKETEALVRIAAEAGAKAAMETLDKERKKERKSRHDKRLRNTKLLLRNYRMFKAHAANAVYKASQLDENAIDILDLMWGRDRNEEFVESIKKSAQRTVIIMQHISDMLDLYEVYCIRSGKAEDARRFRVIESMYVLDERMTVSQIAARENIDERTVYKDVDAAVEKLSALIFGIDSLNGE